MGRAGSNPASTGAIHQSFEIAAKERKDLMENKGQTNPGHAFFAFLRG